MQFTRNSTTITGKPVVGQRKSLEGKTYEIFPFVLENDKTVSLFNASGTKIIDLPEAFIQGLKFFGVQESAEELESASKLICQEAFKNNSKVDEKTGELSEFDPVGYQKDIEEMSATVEAIPVLMQQIKDLGNKLSNLIGKVATGDKVAMQEASQIGLMIQRKTTQIERKRRNKQDDESEEVTPVNK